MMNKCAACKKPVTHPHEDDYGLFPMCTECCSGEADCDFSGARRTCQALGQALVGACTAHLFSTLVFEVCVRPGL